MAGNEQSSVQIMSPLPDHDCILEINILYNGRKLCESGAAFPLSIYVESTGMHVTLKFTSSQPSSQGQIYGQMPQKNPIPIGCKCIFRLISKC